MRHIAYDPYAKPGVAQETRTTLTDLDTVFREADFLCVHCPLTPETRHIVDASRLALMKPTAFLVNTARGPVVDQAALVEALESGRIAGAGLDVLDPEPPPLEAPILRLPNVILAPHALAWTDQCFAALGEGCMQSMRAVARGDAPANVVNAAVLESSGFRRKVARWNR
jgi:D-3-phosphoglycerate dehydrogenase